MLKSLAIIGAVSIGLVSYVHAQTASNPPRETQTRQQPSPSITSVLAKQNGSPALQTDPSQEQLGSKSNPIRVALPSRDDYDWIAYYANLFLVAAGLGGLLYARSTLKTIRGQLDEIKAAGIQTDQMLVQAGKQADAALKNAQAVIDSERPWIVVEAEGFPFISFKMVNKGKTPAQLIWYSFFPAHATPVLGEPMGRAHYGFLYDDKNAQLMNEPMLFPDESRYAGAFNVTTISDHNPERWKEINLMQRSLYVYSAIRYKGPFGPETYETKYCYMVTGKGPKMMGDVGYNEHT